MRVRAPTDRRFRVFLDGDLVRLVLEADDEKGFIVCAAVDDRGKPAYDEQEGLWKTVRKTGKVRIYPIREKA